MSKPWDDAMKRLIAENPQAFVELFLPPETKFLRFIPTELKSEPLYADSLLEVSLYGKSFLLHIEFQASSDPTMMDRLLPT